ncbi:tetratricopeptide repeat protein [Geobacter sp. AOG2]|uniref:tetratricopeptide repeat-containing glycosyltransferase family protein n=1 Tax=Geobacter sp. AOG2 TaxID=1566347 RepID=UPI001CC817F5|nr:tetratricopeptide repeat-containing glycosyltransferase family protein [Geobacter sp. AOG2]GFE59671.1 hypothetical protein AOG2_02590 [Geobacter sp. AOG2]
MRCCDECLAAAMSLHDAGRFPEALSLYDQARALCADSPAYWNNRANTLLELNRLGEAAESYRAALALCPSLTDTRVALATCLQGLGRIDEALVECDTVLSVHPEHAEAHWNRGLLQLLSGNYEQGWREYEWRWKKRRFTSPRRQFDVPQWGGEPIAGRRILIHAEQGFGDTIQFSRYLPQVSARGAEVIFECHPQLVNLMRSLSGGIHVVPFGRALPRFDLQCPLLSLPGIFGTTLATIPSQIPYLSEPVGSRQFWGSILPATPGFKVGLCWKGKQYPDPGRSCPTGDLAALGDGIPGTEFFSLQMDEEHARLPFPCNGFAPLLLDFCDTAALIGRLDLVISIDTAVAHLAGALGSETWVMLPYSPDWRWGRQGDTTPWYPNMRLFRQKEINGWVSLVEKVASELTRWCAARGRAPYSAIKA